MRTNLYHEALEGVRARRHAEMSQESPSHAKRPTLCFYTIIIDIKPFKRTPDVCLPSQTSP
eukprot:7159784-Pyramimonas_sp.AAC.2